MLGPPVHSAARGGKLARVSIVDGAEARIILLDVEGTTTPIAFVYEVLFPYASRKLEPFLCKHFQDSDIQSLIEEFEAQRQLDERQRLQPPSWSNDPDEARLCSTVAYAQWLIAKDSKCTPLKSLQGKIWQEGFTTGELLGQVYPDVPPAFARWRRQKRDICIYSSGSVLAQQLLFRTVVSGDLTSEIAGFFDTRMGIKTHSDSYKKIATSLGRTPCEFLFISDALKEVEAAQSAAMQALLCDRAGSPTSPLPGRKVIRNFDEVFPD
jgi:enolase-phosphatase E1